ncbi:TetR/AcrR family transcriptional regulator [Desulfobotulus sp. H1]|uniref:TetR/AcrR family transcriptional regulator n=1 Tax=Desulfobotulus pelophilus TaxID=2823377 RepID=A0ABT3NAU8_9BACT|nr:TetR/AcrR family transcriptional regulator [Desulfobotulus pelophilus]MCW7754579.1 TetR/AcrR family transcriptional regulator [Desulfobotulus pelophilus]
MPSSEERARIKQYRIMKYFVGSAAEIIKKEGVGAVTIRRASDLAGYASATMYNYFDNLHHLVFLATMNYLEEYNAALPHYIAHCRNSVERYMAVSKCFTEYSYAEPEIYELLFFTHSDQKLELYTQQYYELFPEKIVEEWPVPLNKIYKHNSIYARSFMMLEDCIQDGFITRQNAEDFNDVSLRFYKSILQDVRSGVMEKEPALILTMKYYRQVLGCYMEPEHRYLLSEYSLKI